jgi:diguanylate cyclase (GGDEF)-like protein
MRSTPDRSQRVLLIEDDDEDAVLVQRALERFPGFELRHVRRMQAALDTLAADDFDVALLDLSLPDSFGLQGVATLRTRFADLPVVVLTGLDDNNLALAALEQGAQDYLAKCQCAPELLVRTLRYAIQRQQFQRENRRLMDELARQARDDALTGIVNRRSLVAELEREWSRVLRSGEPLSCVLLDVDFFKRVNDTHGHAAGDLVLQALAGLLRKTCRLGDFPGRYGGEEFLIILPETTEEGAVTWADRLRQTIADTPIAIGSETVHVTVSFGVAERTPEVASGEQLVDRADQALRLAKQLGRDRVVSFTQTMALMEGAGTTQHDAFVQLTAKDIMTPLVATLEESTTLREATEFLLDLRLDSAPIVDRQGNFVGMVGEEDLAHALTGPDAWQRPVAEIMRKKPACFSAGSSASGIHDFLTRVAVRRVVILDAQRPVGIVSRANILRWHEYHELASRSMLTKLSQRVATPSATWDALLQLVSEVGRQAADLHDRLQTADDSPVSLAVAVATRIQVLLEDAVVQAQRLEGRCAEQATIGGMLD